MHSVKRQGKKQNAEARLRVISHNNLIKWFEKVNSPTKPSTFCFIPNSKQQVDVFVGELTF